MERGNSTRQQKASVFYPIKNLHNLMQVYNPKVASESRPQLL